jgi:hypothetical protein
MFINDMSSSAELKLRQNILNSLIKEALKNVSVETGEISPAAEYLFTRKDINIFMRETVAAVKLGVLHNLEFDFKVCVVFRNEETYCVVGNTVSETRPLSPGFAVFNVMYVTTEVVDVLAYIAAKYY